MPSVSGTEDRTRHTARPLDPGAASDSRHATVGPDDALIDIGQRLIVSHVVEGALHDFNNSLQIISGVAELLLRRPDLPEAIVEKLQTIADRTVRAAATVARVQLLSRATDRRASEIDVRQLAGEALECRRYAMSRMGVAGRLEPTSDGASHVRSDPGRVRLALIGLLIYAEGRVRGRPDSEVVLAVQRVGDRVAVHVRTNVAHAWESARTALAVTSEGFDGGSTGVALRLARAVVTAEGGSVTVVEGPGAGASLCLELPAAC